MGRRSELIVVFTDPDVKHPGTESLGRGLDGSRLLVRKRRRRDLSQGNPSLNLVSRSLELSEALDKTAVPSASPEGPEDLVDVYPPSTPIYNGLPTKRGRNSQIGSLWVGFLPSRQVLVPVADESGVIQGESERGPLVHYIGIDGLKISEGWLPYNRRIDPQA